MHRTNLPMDLLRTFITVADLGGYTKAGDVLGRTQPAISLQMRRLEEIVGVKLLSQERRNLSLTDDGARLAVYARQILCLNDEAISRFHEAEIAGTIRVGLPTDYAVAFLQGVLTEYVKQHAEVNLETYCELSKPLLEGLAADDFDVVIAMTGERVSQHLSRAWVERPIWAASEDLDVSVNEVVPIVAHPEGCEYRNRMVESLSSINRQWRIVYSSPGVNSLQTAVLSGLGVSALTKRTMMPGMKVLNPEDGFPPLANIQVGLYYKHPRMTDAGLALVNHLTMSLDDAEDRDFKRLSAHH